MSTLTPDKLLTKDDVCELLGIKRHTLDYAVRTRQIASVKVLGKVRFHAADVHAYLERQRRPALDEKRR